MKDVKRYEAVHIRYEDSNIRYGEGCEVEMVTARDYDLLNAELSALNEQMRLHSNEDGLWLQLKCDGKCFAINLDTVHTARWFVEAYRAKLAGGV